MGCAVGTVWESCCFKCTDHKRFPLGEMLVLSLYIILDTIFHSTVWNGFICLNVFIFYCFFPENIINGFPVNKQFLYNKIRDLVHLLNNLRSTQSQPAKKTTLRKSFYGRAFIGFPLSLKLPGRFLQDAELSDAESLPAYTERPKEFSFWFLKMELFD